VQTDTDEYPRKRDGLPPNEMCSRSRDIFKIWKITDNISETLQDIIVAMEDYNRKSYVTLSELKD